MSDKNQAAVSLGRQGGLKRAENKGWEKIPKRKRKAAAKKAAEARWAKSRLSPNAKHKER